VITPVPSLAAGGHFYVWAGISATIFSIYQTTIFGHLTNNEHCESWEVLRRMGIDFARRMELRMDNKFPDADTDRQCLFLLIYAILSQCVAVRDHFPQPEVLEEMADILEFCTFLELMVVVQPEFNKDSFVSLSQLSMPLHVQNQYLQLVEARRQSRRLISFLDLRYNLRSGKGRKGQSHRIRTCFKNVLAGTANELSHMLHFFTGSALQDDHYAESGMQRCFMITNLERVIDYWNIRKAAKRIGEWGSVQYRDGVFTVEVQAQSDAAATNKSACIFPLYRHLQLTCQPSFRSSI
jgi:hypothetical protein